MDPSVFDKENETYEKHKAELLKIAPGAYVIIKGNLIAGIFPSNDAAMRFGYQRFGIDTLFMCKQIRDKDEVVLIPSVFSVGNPASGKPKRVRQKAKAS